MTPAASQRPRALPALFCLTLLLVSTTAVWAQTRTTRIDTIRVLGPNGKVRIMRGITVGKPGLFSYPPNQAVSQHPYAPLTAPQLRMLRVAQNLRARGKGQEAADTLDALLTKVPHHPLVVTERGRVHLQQKTYAELERLARFERYNQKDSLLLGTEMVEALIQLDRPRDAARIVLETWGAASDRHNWGNKTIIKLLPGDMRGIRDLVLRAVERLPERLDLVRTLARIEWRLGDSEAALRVIRQADRHAAQTPLRWTIAEEMLQTRTPDDTTSAIAALLDLAGDPQPAHAYRMSAARRVWRLYAVRKASPQGARRILDAFADLEPDAWQPDLLISVARELRRAGLTTEARALLDPQAAAGRQTPELALERALADLRDGPPGRALPELERIAGQMPEAAFRHAEALFYAGLTDSALASYGRIAENPKHPFAGASLERIYLIEDADPREALNAFGRIAYQEWRDEPRRARALAESLYTELPRGPMWAQAAIKLSDQLHAAGKLQGALVPVLALADSLPEDRLASLARQKAGNIYMVMKDEKKALEQYEECLARYPRAWNAPEVRRKVLKLRRELPIDTPQTPSTGA